MTRGGKRTPRRPGQERTCIVSGAVRPQREMIRLVAGPDGRVVPDILNRLPGRGAWVGAERALFESASLTGALRRGLRGFVQVPEGPDALADEVEALLARHVQGLISLARKAGEAVAGHEKVKGWLQAGRATMLLQAHDGSARERARLWSPRRCEEDGITLVTCLSAAELGLAFGRVHAIHAAIAAGGLATRITWETARLAGMRRGGVRPGLHDANRMAAGAAHGSDGGTTRREGKQDG